MQNIVLNLIWKKLGFFVRYISSYEVFSTSGMQPVILRKNGARINSLANENELGWNHGRYGPQLFPTRKNCLPVFLRSMANESTESILQSARYVHHSNRFALVTSNPRPHIKCRSHYTALRSILKHFYRVFSWEFWAKCVRFPPLLRDTIMGWIPNRTQAKAGLWLVNIRVFTIKQLTPGFRADSGRLAVTGLPRTGPSRALRHRSVRGRFGPYGSERVNTILARIFVKSTSFYYR